MRPGGCAASATPRASPGTWTRRNALRADVPAADRGDLYRCGRLAAAGVPVAVSSDAPYGPLDPWAVIDAAYAAAPGRGPSWPEARRYRRAPHSGPT